MDDESVSQPSVADARFLLAATVALVGSAALLWRVSNAKPSSSTEPSISASSAPESLDAAASSADPDGLNGKDPKSNRSKERRRRGKDPFKDLLKNGKKLNKVLRTATPSEPPTPSTAGFPARRDPSMSSDTSSRAVAHVDTGIQTEPSVPEPEPEIPYLSQSSTMSSQSSEPISDMSHASTSTSLSSLEDWVSPGLSVKKQAGYRKPPRFRSHSPQPPILDNGLLSPPTSSTSSGPGGDIDEITLTGQMSPPLRVPTPGNLRRTPSAPTSHNGTPPPNVSVQTQIASMRGALEASRTREDKHRLDYEQANKDLEAARWENGMWRKREAEMQTQLQWAMHQLHGYANVFAHQQQAAAQHMNMLQQSSQVQNGSSLPSSPVTTAPISTSSAQAQGSQPQSPVSPQPMQYHPMLSPQAPAPMPMMSPPNVNGQAAYFPPAPMPGYPQSPPQHPQLMMMFPPSAYANAAPSPSSTSTSPWSASTSSTSGSRRGRKRTRQNANATNGVVTNGSGSAAAVVLTNGGWVENGTTASSSSSTSPAERLIDEFPSINGVDEPASSSMFDIYDSAESESGSGRVFDGVSGVLADAILKRPSSFSNHSASSSSSARRRMREMEMDGDDDTPRTEGIGPPPGEGDEEDEGGEGVQEMTWPSIYPSKDTAEEETTPPGSGAVE